jgi:DNA-binding Lrp family transcriptional regulator
MSAMLDDLDRRLLNLVQAQVPLVERPFEALAAQLGTSQEDIIGRLTRLRSPPRPVIRQISAIFDSQALGYRSTLVAAKLHPALIERAAAVVNLHPGVSHNYQRNHEYNLWYTLAVGPDSRLGLEGTVDVLHCQSGAMATRMLPTLRLFKIGVKLDLSGEGDPAAQSESPAFTQDQRDRAGGSPLTDGDKRMIRVLQQDLPMLARPFDAWAAQAGVGVADLLAAAGAFLQQRRMRRFSAVLRHREAGFSANAMGIWIVPPDRIEAFGRKAATFSAVSHCYHRPTYADWPYSVFTMVHGQSPADCEAVLKAIAEATGFGEYSALYSSREFKKVRVKYFTGDIEAWEAAAQAST